MLIINLKRLTEGYSNFSASYFVILLLLLVCFFPDGFAQNISGGEVHSLGLKSDGVVVCWGKNTSGQCNVPFSNSGFVAVAAGGNHSLGLKSDGSVVCWGDNSSGQCNIPSPNSAFVAISAGKYHSVGLKSDGTVVCWGDNTFGQGNVSSPNSGFVAIAAGGYHSVGLKSNGLVVCWGNNSSNQCNVPSPNSGFVAVAAGMYHSAGLKSDRSVVCWGYNVFNQCDVPLPNSGFFAVAAGDNFTAGLKSDSSVLCWGDHSYSQCDVPSPGCGFVAVSAGYSFSVGLKSDKSILCWGSNLEGQCNVPVPNSGFRLISSPVAMAAGNISGSSFTARWNSVFTAAGYQVDVSTQADFSVSEILISQNVPGRSATSFTVTGLTPGTTYYYRVRAYDESNISHNSVTISTLTKQIQNQFITFNPLPDKIYGDAPFKVSATGGASGNPVIFTSSDSTVAFCSGENGTTIVIQKAGTCAIYANQTGNASYYPASQVEESLTITPKEIVLYGFAASDKIYDGTTYCCLSGCTLEGVVDGDSIILNTGTGYFSDKNIGTDKMVTLAGFTLEGRDTGNYKLCLPAILTADIVKAALTIGITAQDKIYDGNANASVMAYIINGMTGEDTLLVSALQGSFEDSSVGTGKKVTAQISISGKDASNYMFNDSAFTFANIFGVILSGVVSTNPDVNYIKGNSPITFTITYSDAISPDLASPLLVLSGSGINGSYSMLTTNHVSWIYSWNPPPAGNGIISINAAFQDNEIIQTLTGKTSVILDNVPPVVTFANLPNSVTPDHSAMKISFSEPVSFIGSELAEGLMLLEGDMNGTEVTFQSADFNSGLMTGFIITADFNCNTQYYLAVKAGSFMDRAGNQINLTEKIFITESNPAIPVIGANSEKTLLCPNDILTISNYNRLLNYQWFFDGMPIPDQTGEYFHLPLNGAGYYSVKAVKPLSGCESVSEEHFVQLQKIVPPVIVEKKETGLLALLIVNNLANTYAAYLWTYPDGSPLPWDILNNRQFLALTGTDLNGEYIVTITDINGCKLQSEIVTVSAGQPAVIIYPSVSDGIFNIDIMHPESGYLTVKIYNAAGMVLKECRYMKSNLTETFRVNLKSSVPGQYMVEVNMNGYREVQCVLIK